MRILIVTNDCWNDQTNGNNIYSNWFDGFDAEFANLYAESGGPCNSICKRYFQVTDRMMLTSLFTNKKAGRYFVYEGSKEGTKSFEGERKNVRLYGFLKNLSSEPLRLARDILWSLGHYDVVSLKRFIDDFAPDIIFCPHLFSIKTRRLERLVHSLSKAPMVAFTGDAEASLENFRISPMFWFRQIILHLLYPSHLKLFSHYFTFSERQSSVLTDRWGIPSSTLYKCVSGERFQEKGINEPIKIVYAGRLYCNRWKTLSAIGDSLLNLNRYGVKAELYVYTQDRLTKRIRSHLSSKKSVYLMGGVSPSELKIIYRNADIALHVESFDKRYKYATMHSFSTKIIDLMNSSCAIVAICWEHNNGWLYLNKEDAAICLSSYSDINLLLDRIAKNPSIISDYARKAYACGQRNHSKALIQNKIYTVFNAVIAEK